MGFFIFLVLMELLLQVSTSENGPSWFSTEGHLGQLTDIYSFSHFSLAVKLYCLNKILTWR